MTAKVDHNYPTPDALRVVDDVTSAPLENIIIRIYDATKYPTPSGSQDVWEAQTTSDVDGKWRDPAYLPDGMDWVVQFSQRLTYGTKTVEIST